MTEARDFATLTFGLLEGWWLSEDPERRLPHGPLLDNLHWQAALAEEGFEVVQVFGERLPQNLFLCEKQTVPATTPPSASESEVPIPVALSLASFPLVSVGIQDAIEAVVTRAVADVFEMSVAQVEAGKVMSFRDFGADSILSAELMSKINAALQLSLPTTAIFNYPGVKELARFIAEEHGASVAQRLPSTGAEPQSRQVSPVASRPSDIGKQKDANGEELADILRQLEAGELSCEEALQRHDGELSRISQAGHFPRG